ncbi:hypothetical protein HK099_004293 [Clydaea vesicula]|uniref:Uncharacterized protein n=1 Tax=Clydaea vesicula TaxID=447962 RepID=A0AAD5XZS5_9FUNG|nr:hypothetical protein HK099_004293 [Clydaea vesicula]
MGFAILKPFKNFGPKENCSVQTAATAAGGLSAGFVSAIPALYRLGLLSTRVMDDFVTLLLWSLCAAYYGLFFAIPLRNYFIFKQNLPFPSPTIAANTIKSLHCSKAGELGAKKKAKILGLSFLFALVVKCVTWWVPVVTQWHILYYVGNLVNSTALQAADVVWRWRMDISLAFLASGMLVGMNTASTFFIGSVVSWAIIGPILFAAGVVNTAYGFPKYDTASASFATDDLSRKVSAQFWLLWPGVTIMIVSAFCELFAKWRMILHSFSGLTEIFKRSHNGDKLAKTKLFGKKEENNINDIELVDPNSETSRLVLEKEIEKEDRFAHAGDHHEIQDNTPAHEQVPLIWWLGGLVVSSTFTIVVLTVLFKVPFFQSVLAILVGFVLAFVGVQSSGETDINPTGSIGKTSQFMFAAFRTDDVNQMLRTNLVAGNVAASCAAQTVDMVGDLKTGYLLNASPKAQFIAQMFGSLVAVFVSVGLFTLFGTTYPCFLAPITTINATVVTKPCQFQAPTVASWTAVTLAVTTGISRTVPMSSGYFSLALTIFIIIFTIFKYKFLSKTQREYLPNLNGSLVCFFWKRRSPTSFEIFGFALASGFVAGEGIGGIFEAVINLSGFVQERDSIKWGIPPTSLEIDWFGN